MKYFIIAGEPSGDLHGSALVSNLIAADPAAYISCWGGDLMKKAGAVLLKHYRDTAFMGAWEVLLNIRRIKANFRECRQQITEMRPDVVILIDYPGFNLRIARYVKQLGIKVYYYISPKFWAWREGRVKSVKKYVDRMYIIFPFEKEFYKRHGYDAIYMGNPLIDHVESWRRSAATGLAVKDSLGLDTRPVIVLLAGSRQQEVAKILPVMASTAAGFPDYQFVVAGMDHLPAELYDRITAALPVRVINGRTYDLLSVAEAALVTSGTATLETALFSVPQVVCYRTSAVTYHLAKLFIKVRFISLVNLIMDREVVRELIQHDLNQPNLHSELHNILTTGYRHEVIKRDYNVLREILGGSGVPARVAEDMARNLLEKSAG